MSSSGMRKFRLNKFERVCFSLLPEAILRSILPRFKRFDFFEKTRGTQSPIPFSMWYRQMVKGHCSAAYWPIHHTSRVGNPKNILCGIEACPGYSPGNYIQAKGRIYVGDYTRIGPNVGIISANHALYDNRKHEPSFVRIGRYCWIGMGAIILPGVELGDFTIVGAGAIVTKSFPEGYCVIAGNPARLVKNLERDQCVHYRSTYEYNGYVPADEFETFRKLYLSV